MIHSKDRHAVLILLTIVLAAGCARAPDFNSALLPREYTDPSPQIRDDYLLHIDPERVELTREYFAIHHPSWAETLPPQSTPDSIVFEPRIIVVHYTAIPTLEETIDTFEPKRIDSTREIIRQNGLLNVGVHFVVDRDGSIYRSYPENVLARHTIGLNHVAVGIENVGTGDLVDPQAEAPLTWAQVDANAALIRHLAARYSTIRYMIGHQEYRELESPRHPAHMLFHEQFPDYRTEKEDPGNRFLKEVRALLNQP
jgi:N-acetylmuramoyl-L-alanine amidase